MAAISDSHFELIIPNEAEKAQVELGSEITIPCHLSAGAQYSVVTDIKWFKETALVCHYEDRQVKEGMGYDNRVRLLIEEINKGNVSLSLKEFKESDFGDYLCQVTCGSRTKEITIKVEDFSKKKKERNKVIGYTVGAIGLAALPVTGVAAVFGGAICAALVAGAAAVGATAATAALVIVFQIYFSMINRTYSLQERKAMEISLQLAVRTYSGQERRAMERSLQVAGAYHFNERRNSLEGNPPTMSE